MKKRIFNVLIIVLFGIWLIPCSGLAHHMGQGEGAAPDLVDDYAHGVNAGGDVDSGYGSDFGSGLGPDDDINMGDGNGMAEVGDDSNGYGGPTADGDNGPTEDIPGNASEPGGPNDDMGVNAAIFDQLVN